MSRAGLRALGGLLAISIAWSPLFAQQTRAVETGIAAVDFADDEPLTFGPWLRGEVARELAGARTRGAASVIAGSGAASGSADASAWWRGAIGGRAAWEAGGEGSALFGSRLHSSESVLAGARLSHPVGAQAGIWLRGTGHLAWREAGALHGSGLEAGTWYRLTYATLSTSVLHERAQGQLFDSDSRDRVLGVVPVRYDEASLAVSTDEWWGSLDAMAGARRDPDAAQLVEPMWRVSALVWQTASRAVSVNVARQPADFIHGADASYSVSVGVHFGVRAMTADNTRTSRPTVQLLDAGAGVGRYLRVRAPSARTVEMMADFTGWDIVTLVDPRTSRAEAEFTFPKAVSPGTHRVMLRIDGGPWLPPANLPQIDDDFGGRAGLLVVP